jgi:hypothetical protein
MADDMPPPAGDRRSVLLGQESLLPDPWVALLMEYGDELNSFIARAKVDRVRKSAEQRPSDLVLDLRKLKRTVDRALHHRVEFIEKLVAQSSPSGFIPRHRIGHIDFGLWPDNEASRHPFGLR